MFDFFVLSGSFPFLSFFVKRTWRHERITTLGHSDVNYMPCLVADVPSPPENITIDGVWSRGISLTWTSSKTDGNSLITEYIIQFWKESYGTTTSSPDSSIHGDMTTSTTNARMNQEEVSSSVTSHVITDSLSPGSLYSLRMMGKNTYGRGPSSPVVRFVTKSEPPSSPPTDVSAESMKSTVIVIKWKPPPRNEWNGPLKGYRVGYQTMSSASSTLSSFTEQESNLVEESWSSSLVSSTQDPLLMYSIKEVPASMISTEEYQLILTGLSKATTYSVIVQAFNDAGEGPFSHPVILTTSFNGKTQWHYVLNRYKKCIRSPLVYSIQFLCIRHSSLDLIPFLMTCNFHFRVIVISFPWHRNCIWSKETKTDIE